MVTQQKATGRATSWPSGLAAGAAVSMAVTMGVCGLGAWLITSEIVSQDKIGYWSMAALVLSAILGGMIAMKRIKQKNIIVGLANGGIYYGLLLALTILFFHGSFQAMGVTFGVIMMGSLAAVLLTNRGHKKNFNGHRRKIRR